MSATFITLVLTTSLAWALDTTPFQQSTIAEHFKSVPMEAKNSTHSYDSAMTALKTAVIYTGRARLIAGKRRKFIENFEKSVFKKATLTSVYKNEIEVKEGDHSYWIMVQKEVFPFLAKELKAGQKFLIFHRFAGTEEGQPIYLMMEFNSPAGGKP
jgi:hypothetical protein